MYINSYSMTCLPLLPLNIGDLQESGSPLNIMHVWLSVWEKHVVRAPTVFQHLNVEISQIDA